MIIKDLSDSSINGANIDDLKDTLKHLRVIDFCLIKSLIWGQLPMGNCCGTPVYQWLFHRFIF